MNRRIAIVAAAVLLALLGTFAVYNYAHHADQRAIAKTRATTVLVAQKSVPAGTSWGDVLKGDYLQEEKIPIDSAPSSAISSLTASVPIAQVATADIAAGQIVLRPAFGDHTAVTGVLPIPAGMVAVTVSMPSNANVGGYIQYKSEVAVFATYKLVGTTGSPNGPKSSLGDKDIYATKLLLARVTVIATSQAPPSDVTGNKSQSTGTGTGTGNGTVLITLALTQAQAERVILSQQIGQLYMALLSDNSVTAEDSGVIGIGIFRPVPVFVK